MGPSEKTVIGINSQKSVLFVDRTHSGDISFALSFSGRQTTLLDLVVGLPVKLHIFVDRCSVEVFAGNGDRVISDLIFPSRTSQDVDLFSKSGSAKVVKLDIWNLKSAWMK